jgi:hypothetical protein
MAQIKTNKKIKIRSIVQSVFHSLIIPIGLSYVFENILGALIWWIFAFAMYEYTEEGQEKAGRTPFMVLTTIMLVLVIALMLTVKGA